MYVSGSFSYYPCNHIKTKPLIFLALIFSFNVYADVLDVKLTNQVRESFDYKDVCASFGVKEPLLINKASRKKIDCMGKEFLISKFCAEKFKDSADYAYADFDLVSKKVNCNFASQVIVTFQCHVKYKELCKDNKKGCLGLGKLYARNLNYFKNYLQEIYPPILKCFFSKKENTSLLKPLL